VISDNVEGQHRTSEEAFEMVRRIVMSGALALLVPSIAQAQVPGRLGSLDFGTAPRLTVAQNAAQAGGTGASTFDVGGYIGGELDNSEDWFLIGGHAVMSFEGTPFKINPRFTYHPFDGGKVVQVDVNVVRDYDLATPGRFRPYVGVGGAFMRTSFDGFESDSAVGLNLLSGVRLKMEGDSRFEPFLHAQYTIVRDQFNSFTITIGANFSVR